jgi:hypothetical protein
MNEQEEQERYKLIARSAKVRINFSLTVAAIGVLLIIQGLFFPDPFSSAVIEEELAPVQTSSIDPKDIVNGIHVPSGLIAEEGFELVLGTCAACHSIDLVKQNRATAEGWKEMIVWMQETQGLWELGENEAPIIKYLAKHYAPVNTGRRKNLENIEWYDLKD